MPFCRKCGRRLVEYSERCPDCRTSTTAPLIKIKKASVPHLVKDITPKKVVKTIIPTKTIFSAKVISSTKPAKSITLVKDSAQVVKAKKHPKPVPLAVVYPEHEIIKSNISLKKDITTNPQDYEKQPFDFNLLCPNGHFWPAGKVLIVSNGKAYCLKCGERLRKPKRHRRNRYGNP